MDIEADSLSFLIVQQYAAVEGETTQLIVECLIGGCVAVSMCGVMANMMQFGIDQLTDASSSDICSYISWYTMIISLASNLAAVTQYCFCGSYNQVMGYFILPLLGTAVIVSDLCFNQWLVKEPAVRNPFKLIFQFVRYAMKNKYPCLFQHVATRGNKCSLVVVYTHSCRHFVQ